MLRYYKHGFTVYNVSVRIYTVEKSIWFNIWTVWTTIVTTIWKFNRAYLAFSRHEFGDETCIYQAY